jgi:hypothetical protein
LVRARDAQSAMPAERKILRFRVAIRVFQRKATTNAHHRT